MLGRVPRCVFPPQQPWGNEHGQHRGRTATRRGGTGSVLCQGSLQRSHGTGRSRHGQELGRTLERDHVQPEECGGSRAAPGPFRGDRTEPHRDRAVSSVGSTGGHSQFLPSHLPPELCFLIHTHVFQDHRVPLVIIFFQSLRDADLPFDTNMSNVNHS